MKSRRKFKLGETFKLREVVQGAHIHEVLTALPLIQEYFCMVESMFNIVDNMFGLVAQSGRAPGFYSIRNGNEKIPDGRGFKSPRARFAFDESVKKEWRTLDSSNWEVA